MDVTVSMLRAHLSEWLERVQAGEEVVITDRGTPVARILGVSAPGLLDRLADAGQLGRPRASARPTASGRRRARARRSVADLLSSQRD